MTLKGIKQLKLKVDKNSQTFKDARGKPSSMNIENGISKMTVIIPDKWPVVWRAGAHNIVIDNKVGRATVEFHTEE